jgi:hypothetical protein
MDGKTGNYHIMNVLNLEKWVTKLDLDSLHKKIHHINPV